MATKLGDEAKLREKEGWKIDRVTLLIPFEVESEKDPSKLRAIRVFKEAKNRRFKIIDVPGVEDSKFVQ